MSWYDFSDANFWQRLSAATISLLLLGGLAAAVVVVSMMMVLFSLDSGEGGAQLERTLEVGGRIVLCALAIAVILPPLLLLLRFPTGICLLPAAVGFISAGACTFVVICQCGLR